LVLNADVVAVETSPGNDKWIYYCPGDTPPGPIVEVTIILIRKPITKLSTKKLKETTDFYG
jgi:hypothetical protein